MNRFSSLTLLFCLLSISCNNEKTDIKNIIEPEPQAFGSSYIVSDISFYTADIAVRFDIDETVHSQSKFGLLLSKTSEVSLINSITYPIEKLSSDYSAKFTINELDTATTYYYRCFMCQDGEYEYGDIGSFTTKRVDDVIKTNVIIGDTCIINSDVESNNLIGYIDRCGVCYGKTDNLNIENSNNIDTPLNDHSFSVKIENSHYGTTYFRVYVIINGKAYYGNPHTIKQKMKTAEAIDLGLSVNWASFNVGANSPSEKGYYYFWGELEPRDISNFSAPYIWKDGYKTNKTILDLEDDVAHVQWEGDWRMPTSKEMIELYKNCTIEHVTIDSIEGYKFTSKIGGFTDNSVFFPFTGTLSFGTISDYSYCSYLTSSYDSVNNWGIYCKIYNDACYPDRLYGKNGLAVRPVCPSEQFGKEDASSLSIEKDTIVVPLDETGYYIPVCVKSGDAPVRRPVVWSSSDSTIAYVENGLLRLGKIGTAVIYAKYKDLKDSCIINAIGFQPVDLGLSVLWASCNVGAQNPWEYGDYYAWAETDPKEQFDLFTYKWYIGSIYYSQSYPTRMITKYCSSYNESYLNQPDRKTTIEAEDDIATIIGGNKWHIPTEREISELVHNCKWVWTTVNDIPGYKIYGMTGYTNNYIFLPAAGSYYGNIGVGVGSDCKYWSNKIISDSPNGGQARAISTTPSAIRSGDIARWYGLTIRPVKSRF